MWEFLKFSALDVPYFHFATLSAISCQNIRLKEKMHILYILLQRKMNRNSFHLTHTLLALLFCNFPQIIQCLDEKEENLKHNERRRGTLNWDANNFRSMTQAYCKPSLAWNMTVEIVRKVLQLLHEWGRCASKGTTFRCKFLLQTISFNAICKLCAIAFLAEYHSWY